MAILIRYIISCHCGSDATSTTLDTTNPQRDGSIEIDVEMAATQTRFECDDCGCSTYTGDLDQMIEPDECRGDDDADDTDDEG